MVLDKALTALVSVLFEVFPPTHFRGVVRSPSVTLTEEKTDQMDMDAPPYPTRLGRGVEPLIGI
jgi:hypothetical protein